MLRQEEADGASEQSSIDEAEDGWPGSVWCHQETPREECLQVMGTARSTEIEGVSGVTSLGLVLLQPVWQAQVVVMDRDTAPNLPREICRLARGNTALGKQTTAWRSRGHCVAPCRQSCQQTWADQGSHTTPVASWWCPASPPP